MMTKIKKLGLCILLLLSICSVQANTDDYPFTSKLHAQQFDILTHELRCLVCQNQNIAESNAALAADLRNQIYAQIKQEKSNQEIIDYLVARYGDFILYKPPLNVATFGLWFGPILSFVIGIGYLFYYLRKERRKS
jgi:cytochrome c-type biogenesis protein CcmH